jgi:predicted PurR-regulated permease PerM
MSSHETFSKSAVLLDLAAFVVIVAGMKAAASLLVPFLVAVFLAVLAGPVVFWLKAKGFPSGLAVLVAVILLLGILTLMGTAVGTSVNSFLIQLPSYQRQLERIVSEFATWLSSQGIEAADKAIIDRFDPGAALGFAASILTSVGGLLTNAFLILLTVIFILLEASGFPSKVRASLPNAELTLERFADFARRLKRYVAIKTATSLATGVAVAVFLGILGIDFPLLWGLLAFLLNFIPTLGSILAAIPAILLGLIQQGLGGAALIGIGYLVVNFVIANVLEPRFMGRGVGLSTLVVFISLVVWAWILGPVGALLSVPLTITLKLGLESNENTRWVGILLGPEIVAPEPEEMADTSDHDQPTVETADPRS